MSLYHRLKRRLGYDTRRELERSYPTKEYIVTHLNGDESRVKANGYETDGAFAKFYVYDEPYVAAIAGYDVWPLPSTVRVLEGIKEIESIQYGSRELHATVNLADGAVLEKEARGPP